MTISIGVQDVTNAVLQAQQVFLQEPLPAGRTGKMSLYEINNGLCDEFAREILQNLGLNESGTQGPVRFAIIETANFFKNFEEGDESWDTKLLSKYWGIKCPKGHTWSKLNKLEFGHHVWLAVAVGEGGTWLHFDAECPQGVTSFFELPLFTRCINETWPTSEELALLAPDVVWMP